MPDPLKPLEWKEALGQSFEELRAEATAKRVKRENLQPMELGKSRYKDIFKVGDRTRPELALRQTRPDGEPSGSGEVNLDTLIPKQALRDLADAYASANVGAMGEALEGVRETITYDRDESEQLEWTGHPERHLLIPQAQERISNIPEVAVTGLRFPEGVTINGVELVEVSREDWVEADPELRIQVEGLAGYFLVRVG